MLAVCLALAVTKPYLAPDAAVAAGPYYQSHAQIFGADAPGYNKAVLEGIDKVQSTAPSGGGYFVGVKAVPAESPVGYPVTLLGTKLLDPPRATSYCSGSSYAVFIEALDAIFADKAPKVSPERMEAMRMQEPDGGRREDRVKTWGWWNADGFGDSFALVQYTKMGEHVAPVDARPGDFLNIAWKSGLGHSVVFLGWCHDKDGAPAVLFWSSQSSTNGFADSIVPLSKVKEVYFARLTHPENLASFDPATPVDVHVAGDQPPSL